MGSQKKAFTRKSERLVRLKKQEISWPAMYRLHCLKERTTGKQGNDSFLILPWPGAGPVLGSTLSAAFDCLEDGCSDRELQWWTSGKHAT